MAFYLHVEAVNIYNFVYDTQDLSTIRGGGLLLLEAINQICAEFDFKLEEVISTGASSGLFHCKTDLKEKVTDFLKEHPQFKHATFMVNTIPVTDDFDRDRETLAALTRWQQLQSPTVIYPELSKSQETIKRAVCEMDFVRPALCETKKGGKSYNVSESVYQRREYGRDKKQTFYCQEIEKLKNPPIKPKEIPNFVNDFDELTEDNKRGNLDGKMAVIYLDGNDFGKKQRHICIKYGKEGLGEDGLKEFDEKIKEYRRSFLANLLKDTKDRTVWTNQDKHRLEILLWGGDEMILVVPAWQGWWTLNYFFQRSKDWTVFDPAPNTKPIQLTHAAGLVFCRHNAPIHRIADLARNLAGLAKEVGRENNYVAYQVLESFDYTGDELEAFRQQRCPKGVEQADFIICGKWMDKVLSPIDAIKRALPKGVVYKVVETWLYATQQEAETFAKEVESEFLTTTSSIKTEFEKLQTCFGTGATFWIHLIELWDYLELESTVEFNQIT